MFSEVYSMPPDSISSDGDVKAGDLKEVRVVLLWNSLNYGKLNESKDRILLAYVFPA